MTYNVFGGTLNLAQSINQCPPIAVSIRLTWQHVDETIFELVTHQIRADEMRRVDHLCRYRQPLNKLHTHEYRPVGTKLAKFSKHKI